MKLQFQRNKLLKTTEEFFKANSGSVCVGFQNAVISVATSQNSAHTVQMFAAWDKGKTDKEHR